MVWRNGLAIIFEDWSCRRGNFGEAALLAGDENDPIRTNVADMQYPSLGEPNNRHHGAFLLFLTSVSLLVSALLSLSDAV